MKNRLLILSTSIGAGHAKAGEALCEAYTANHGGEAHHIDFLRYTSPTFGLWVEQMYYAITKHTPSVYKLLYKLADHPNSPVKKSEVYIGLSKYKELLKEYRPDAIISTHFFPAAVTSYLYPRFRIPNSLVLTDYTAHHIFVNSNTNLFFAGYEGVVNELKELGVEESRIRVTGIPIRPCFAKRLDQRAARIKLELEPDLPVILIMSGGNAIGPLVDVLETLGRLTEKFQVIAIAGHNQKSYLELQQVLARVSLRGRILGFVENIHEYMAAADLLISKAGGLTVAEALAASLPMLIIRPTPGQEDANTLFLTKAGAALHLKSTTELEPVVGKLLREPAKIETLKNNAARIAKPDAAEAILREMEYLIAAKKGVEIRTSMIES
jgi:processive 1,2-diacylglycerol beta-glucosyltransferase